MPPPPNVAVAPPPPAEADTGDKGLMNVIKDMNENISKFGGKLDNFGTQMGQVRSEAKDVCSDLFAL